MTITTVKALGLPSLPEDVMTEILSREPAFELEDDREICAVSVEERRQECVWLGLVSNLCVGLPFLENAIRFVRGGRGSCGRDVLHVLDSNRHKSRPRNARSETTNGAQGNAPSLRWGTTELHKSSDIAEGVP